MTIALLNRPSRRLAECELTFVDREPISHSRALEQHENYARVLGELGLSVTILRLNDEMPDGVFVEDAAIVLDEIAIITPMGTASRRPEVPAIESELRKHRNVVRVELPATLEGGDVLKVARTLYIGETTRTNKAAIAAVARIVEPLGYKVMPVPVRGGLHLKTCITALNERTFIANPEWLDLHAFQGHQIVSVHEHEAFAANVLLANGMVLMNAAYPRTADLVSSLGFATKVVEISEFGKAEAGLTCLSLIFERR